MANEFAILSLADSLARRLADAYPGTLRSTHACGFEAIGSGRLQSDPPLMDAGATVTVWPYRVAINSHARAHPRAVGKDPRGQTPRPLALDVHLLLSVWSARTATELVVFAWAVSELHRKPFLDATDLSGGAHWGPGDVIELVPNDLGVEDTSRLWGMMRSSYRLSAPYVARVVSIDVADPGGQ